MIFHVPLKCNHLSNSATGIPAVQCGGPSVQAGSISSDWSTTFQATPGSDSEVFTSKTCGALDDESVNMITAYMVYK